MVVSRLKSKPVVKGRPRSESATSHGAIMDAVSGLLEEIPAHDLTMEAIATRAGVGKPTLYKWWPSKAALIMAMFQERFNAVRDLPETASAEEALRERVKQLIVECNGLFGKVFADLIAEGQRDPSILKELMDSHIYPRRASAVAEIQRGVEVGELVARTDPELLIDAVVAPVYLRLLLRRPPLTQDYGTQLIDQALQSIRNPSWKSSKPAKR